LQACLKHDVQATADKPERNKALKFCIWGRSKLGFWNRHYSSYHIVYDPSQELHQKGLFQVRFMFFLNRKQTSNGRFNQAVKEILCNLGGRRKFTFVVNDEIVFLYRPYSNSGWQNIANEDLAWLISRTFSRFEKLPSIRLD
jgi:hypothetical protein